MWQYYNGRAVIIGVFSVSMKGDDHCTQSHDLFVRVSMYIDWIISVTGLDIEHLAVSGHMPHFTDFFNPNDFLKLLVT